MATQSVKTAVHLRKRSHNLWYTKSGSAK